MVLDEVQPLLDPATPETAEEVVFGNDARAVALMNLGAIELWSFRHDDAERHLEQGLDSRVGSGVRTSRSAVSPTWLWPLGSAGSSGSENDASKRSPSPRRMAGTPNRSPASR